MLDQTALTKDETEGRALDRRLREYAQQRASLDAAEAYDLVRAESLRIYLFQGYATFWEYMERVLGYSPHAARERMRVARALVTLPSTSAALAAGKVTFSAARELTRILTPDTEDTWLADTEGMTAHQIEQLVAGRHPGDLPDDPKPPDTRERLLKLRLPPEIYALWRQARLVLAEELDGEVSDLALIEAMCRRMIEPGSGADQPAHQIAYKQCPDCKAATQNGAGLELGVKPAVIERAECDARFIGSLDAPSPERATSSVTPRIREQVFARDNQCCAVPGCRSRRNLEVHHLRPQALGGTHDLSNLMLICSGHHAAHHAGMLQIRGEAPWGIQVRWTYGPPLPPGLSPEERQKLLRDELGEHGPRLDEWTRVPRGTRSR